jgi:hypothetical protein
VTGRSPCAHSGIGRKEKEAEEEKFLAIINHYYTNKVIKFHFSSCASFNPEHYLDYGYATQAIAR